MHDGDDQLKMRVRGLSVFDSQCVTITHPHSQDATKVDYIQKTKVGSGGFVAGRQVFVSMALGLKLPFNPQSSQSDAVADRHLAGVLLDPAEGEQFSVQFY